MGKIILAKINKIAILIFSSAKPGGVERRFFRLFRYLKLHKNDVHLIVSEETYKYFNDNDKSNITVFKKEKGLFKNTLNILKIIKIQNIKMIHCAFNPSLLSVMLGFFSPLYRYKVSISSVAWTKNRKNNFTLIEYLSFQLTFLLVDKIDFLSPMIYEKQKNIFSFKKDKSLISPCSFTDYNLFVPFVNDAKDIDIVFVSRLTEGKGIEFMMDALEEIVNRKLNVIICGDGPYREYILQHNANIIHNIKVEYVKSSLYYLQKSKIFLSLQEGNNYPSQSLIEAMACECAVIASNVGETELLVKNEVTGFLVSLNSREISKKIIYLLNNENKLNEIGKNAKEFVKSNHTLEIFAKYFREEIFDDK